MANPQFQFKQFTVFHDKAAMKVGADSVSLGAWANLENAKKVLDIGCGSGLISLMVAQRSRAEITAIDIDVPSVEQTFENAANSPWSNRIRVLHQSVQDFAASSNEHFDYIISNPPFFVNSLKNSSIQRATARHTDSLPFEDLIQSVAKLLTAKGVFSLILPIWEVDAFLQLAESYSLYCLHRCTLFPNPNRPAKRVLLELSKEKRNCNPSELIIEQERGVYTVEYYEMVKEFYLEKAP